MHHLDKLWYQRVLSCCPSAVSILFTLFILSFLSILSIRSVPCWKTNLQHHQLAHLSNSHNIRSIIFIDTIFCLSGLTDASYLLDPSIYLSAHLSKKNRSMYTMSVPIYLGTPGLTYLLIHVNNVYVPPIKMTILS